MGGAGRAGGSPPDSHSFADWFSSRVCPDAVMPDGDSDDGISRYIDATAAAKTPFNTRATVLAHTSMSHVNGAILT